MKKRLLTSLVVLMVLFLLSASIVWSQPAPVAKTGQTISYQTGDDGYYQKGVASPSPRFTDNGDGTVTDNLTGLMWAKNAGDNGKMTWFAAINYANNLSLGGVGCDPDLECGGCGQPACGQDCKEDWRLPNRAEMESLFDFSNYDPALPSGHPFINMTSYMWSSTTYAGGTDLGWIVHPNGYWCSYGKTRTYFALPVRGEN
jgi:hypothetical protein